MESVKTKEVTMLTQEQKKLVEGHVRLARKRAWSFTATYPHMESDELIGVAEYFLCVAAGKFKPEMGYAFSTYATRVIDSKLINFCNRESLRTKSYDIRDRENTTRIVKFDPDNDEPGTVALYANSVNQERHVSFNEKLGTLSSAAQRVCALVCDGIENMDLPNRLKKRTLVCHTKRDVVKRMRREGYTLDAANAACREVKELLAEFAV